MASLGATEGSESGSRPHDWLVRCWRWMRRTRSVCVLTHVELPDEAGHVVVLEVQRQEILGELDLVEDDEAAAALRAPEVGESAS